MNRPKVSVIVPIYNVEAYLQECLESLEAQTLKDIEFILVNDGSPDGSQTIVDGFVKRDPQRFKSHIKSNGGLSDARNFGLKLAKGDYIGFVDSDDTIEPMMYQTMLDIALKSKSDLVVCDLEYAFEDANRNYTLHGYDPKLDKPRDHSIFLSPLFAWNKLYSKSLFEKSGLEFPLGQWYEDIPVTVPLFALAQSIQYIPETFVHYRQRSTSIMGALTHPKMFDIFISLDKVYSFYKTRQLLDGYHDEIEYLFIEHLLLYGGFRFLRSDDFEALMDKAFSTMAVTFPNWRKNPYLKTLKPLYQWYLKGLNAATFPWMRPLIQWKGTHV